MGTKEYEVWYERVLQKNNTGTYTISLPINVVRGLRWQQGQRLKIVIKGKQISLQDAD